MGLTPPYLLCCPHRSHLEANLTWEPQLSPAAVWEGVPRPSPTEEADFTKHHLKTIGHQESQGGLSMLGLCV